MTFSENSTNVLVATADLEELEGLEGLEVMEAMEDLEAVEVGVMR